MLITIKDIAKEQVKTGRNPYGKATVTYDYNGQTRTQSVISFANADVYKALDSLSPGDRADVTVTKNASGYNQWAELKPVGKGEDIPAPAPSASGTAPAKASGTWETAEERAKKQVYIIRQSSLDNAIKTLSAGLPSKEKLQVEDVLNLAGVYVDWVLSGDQPGMETSNSDLGDIPL